MDLDDARAAAERLLDERVRPQAEHEILLTRLWEFPAVWAGLYNTVTFWVTGELDYSLSGVAPLIIDKDSGAARLGEPGVRIDEQVTGEGSLEWTAPRPQSL